MNRAVLVQQLDAMSLKDSENMNKILNKLWLSQKTLVKDKGKGNCKTGIKQQFSYSFYFLLHVLLHG